MQIHETVCKIKKKITKPTGYSSIQDKICAELLPAKWPGSLY